MIIFLSIQGTLNTNGAADQTSHTQHKQANRLMEFQTHCSTIDVAERVMRDETMDTGSQGDSL